MSERRQKNGRIRQQAQSWFDALRSHFTAANAQNDIAERLRTWENVEALMSDCPQLFPPLMTMAWQMRAQPGFAEFFQTSKGGLAADTTTPLSPSGKSFEEIVVTHLQGAMRVYCEHQEKAWLAGEQARHKPTGLATVKSLAPLIRKLKRQRDEDFLERYPQRGLYDLLKPHLRHANQFALIEALATLPTRTAKILGDALCGLTIEPSIRNIAQLETAKCKFVTTLARSLAETVVEAATDAATAGSLATLQPKPVRANVGEIAGTALSHLAVDGLHLAKAAILVRDQAPDVVMKMSLSLGYDLRRVFANPEAVTNIAHCPPALAKVLGADTVNVNPKTSEALKSLKTPIIIETMAASLFQAAGRQRLARWAADDHCATGWQCLANELNQQLEAHGDGALSEAAVAQYCQTLVPSFGALSGETAAPASYGATPRAPDRQWAASGG